MYSNTNILINNMNFFKISSTSNYQIQSIKNCVFSCSISTFSFIFHLNECYHLYVYIEMMIYFADVNTYLALQLYYNIIIISLQNMPTRHLQRFSHLTKIANYVLTASLTTLQTLFSCHNLSLPSFLKRSSTSCIHLYLYSKIFSCFP